MKSAIILIITFLAVVNQSIAQPFKLTNNKWLQNPSIQNFFIKNDSLHFLKNGKEILYWSKLGDIRIYFLDDEIQFHKIIKHDIQDLNEPSSSFDKIYKKNQTLDEENWSIKFSHTNSKLLKIIPINKQSFTYNHSLQYDDVIYTVQSLCYDTLVYAEIWPKIDIRFFLPKKGGVKYDVLIHSGGNPSDIQFNYDNVSDIKLSEDGSLVFSTEMGIITDEFPKCKDLTTKKEVNCEFLVRNKNVSFYLDSYNKENDIIIDPWLSFPIFSNSSDPFDIEYDNNGNVYIYSAYGDEHEVKKYSSNGLLLWTFMTAFNTYGDFAVSKSTGDCYLVKGFEATFFPPLLIKKFNTNGIFINQYQGTTNDFNEAWRCIFDEKRNNLIVGAGGFMAIKQAGFIDTALSNLIGINILNATYRYNDVTSMAIDPDGSAAYFLTMESSAGNLYDNKLVKVSLPYLIPTQWIVQTDHHFYESYSIYYYIGGSSNTNGYNGMACGPCYVYTYDGNMLNQWDKSDGRKVNQIQLGLPLFKSGGIDVDTCGNVFVGAGNQIKIFDNTLNIIDSFLLPDKCYDIILTQNGKLYACGISFVTEIDVSHFNCEFYYSVDCNQDCEIKIEMPNVFSPNKDNNNDLFLPVKAECIKEANIVIYNRWGQKLYSSKNLFEGWDGTTNSDNLVPSGTYFWIVTYTDKNEKKSNLTGYVTLLR